MTRLLRSRTLAPAALSLASRAALVALVAGLAAPACYSSGNGTDPNDYQFYYPVGLSLSRSGNTLFVVNSDFDLAFNGGTVVALDAQAIAADALACSALPEPAPGTFIDPNHIPAHPGQDPAYFEYCAQVGVDPTLPGNLWNASPQSRSSYVEGSVRISAFAADVKTVPLYADASQTKEVDPTKGRLLVPERGDAALTYIDYSENGKTVTLDCGGASPTLQFGASCADDHKIGNAGTQRQSAREQTIPGEPFVIATSAWGSAKDDPVNAAGGIAAVVHQSSGSVSAFIGVNLAAPGSIQYAYTLTGMPTNGTGIAALDLPAATPSAFVPRFLVSNLSVASLYTVSFTADPGNYGRSFLGVTDVSPYTVSSPGTDTRSIVVDPPNAGETRDTRVFTVGRSPASVVYGDLDPVYQHIHFYDHAAVPIGPSRLVRAVIGGKTRLYVTAYDARSVLGFDPDTKRFGNVAFVGRGPYAMTIGSVTPTNGTVAHRLGFIVNFIDSTVQVIDLEPLLADGVTANNHFEQVIYTVGVPRGPQS